MSKPQKEANGPTEKPTMRSRKSTVADSVDKVVHMLGVVTREPFTYKSKVYAPPAKLCVSSQVFHSSSCPAGCGACCRHGWSLDWLSDAPGEFPPTNARARAIDFQSTMVKNPTVLTVRNEEFDSPCRHLDLQTAFCGIHGRHPLSCDAPMLEFQAPRRNTGVAYILHKKYGRAWAMKRLDGTGAPDCPIIRDGSGGPETARKLKRLNVWANHFGLQKTWLPDIISWVEFGPRLGNLYLSEATGLFAYADGT